MEFETRTCEGVELRSEEEGVRVSGYAAVYGEKTRVRKEFEERIEPGAFDEALAEDDDVLFLVNHRGLPLARTSSGTLILRADDKGLQMEATLDSEDPDVRSIVPKVRRGDLSKMSFAFVPKRQEWDFSQEVPLRSIKEVRLRDVSLVTRPAYEGTSIALRSMEEHMRSNTNQNMRRARLLDARLRNPKA